MLNPEESFVCSICLGFESDKCPDWFVTTPNGHIFHSTCLERWMRGRDPRCPNCNEKLERKMLTRLHGIDPSCRDLLTYPASQGPTNLHSQIWRDIYMNDYCFTICMVGNSGVGKSSLLNVFTTGVFNESVLATCASDLKIKKVHLDGKVILVNAWDTSGQERYHSMSQNYLRKAHGVVLVYSYDMSEDEISSSIEKWMKFIRENAVPGAAVLLVGNKVDLPRNQQSTFNALDISRRFGLTFFETSAKDHFNVDATFNTLVADIFQRVQANQLEYSLLDRESLRLEFSTPTHLESTSCC